MNPFDSHRCARLTLLAAGLAAFALGCSSDDNHGPTIGAPTGPVVIVEGGSGPTGSGGSGTGANGGATAAGGSDVNAGAGLPGSAGSDFLGAGGTDLSGTAGALGQFGTGGASTTPFGVAGTSASLAGSAPF
jgi:hypothetical protein